MVLSQAFWNFWSSMKYPQTFVEAIKYFEIRFMRYFKQHGFQYTSWIDIQGWTDSCAVGENPYIRYAYELISQYQFPIIKRKSLSVVNFSETRAVWEYVEKQTHYNMNIIKSHLTRLSEENRIKPFSVQMLDRFVDEHETIYVFGHGKYGCALEQYLNYKNLNVEKFVVSKVQNEREIDYRQLQLRDEDGLIVALSERVFKEIEEIIVDNYDKKNLLLPQI